MSATVQTNGHVDWILEELVGEGKQLVPPVMGKIVIADLHFDRRQYLVQISASVTRRPRS